MCGLFSFVGGGSLPFAPQVPDHHSALPPRSLPLLLLNGICCLANDLGGCQWGLCVETKVWKAQEKEEGQEEKELQGKGRKEKQKEKRHPWTI